MKTLFITGATGFIGSRLLQRLNPSNYKNIFCLSRKVFDDASCLRRYDNVKFIYGSLFDHETFINHLAESDIVIHLAAITGKATSEAYFNINAKGTEFLLEQCIKSGVKKFLYISSIAVKFKDIKNYPYAQSKLNAEQYVKTSGINHTILRPTIVVGDGSPVLLNLSKLGSLPVTPIFGDGSVMIQPIFIEDLISCILNILENNTFDNETLDIGGPEQISIESFIRIIHRMLFNCWPRVIHIPIRPSIKVLSFMEKYFLSILPFTAGQLASFSNNGTIDRNRLFDLCHINMKNVNEMLRIALSPIKEIGRSETSLKHECTKYTEYIINCKPNAYIEKKYIEGLKINRIESNIGRFDTFLIKVTNKNAFMIRLADIYTSVFYRKSVFRKKLILLLAVLESCPTTYPEIDSVTGSSQFCLLIQTIQKILVFSTLLLVSCIVLFPIHTMFYLRSVNLRKFF